MTILSLGINKITSNTLADVIPKLTQAAFIPFNLEQSLTLLKPKIDTPMSLVESQASTTNTAVTSVSMLSATSVSSTSESLMITQTVQSSSNQVATPQATTMSLRAPDLKAPIISYEFKNNQFTITSNEAVQITIKDNTGKVIATGSIGSANGTVVIDVHYDLSTKELILSAMDNAGNSTTLTENIPDITAPTLLDYFVDAQGRIALVFSEKLDESALINHQQFSIKLDHNNAVIKSIIVTEITVIIELEDPVAHGQVINLSYADLTTENDLNMIQDVAGNDVLDFKIENIINNSEVPPAVEPLPYDIHFYDDVNNGVSSTGQIVVEEILMQSITNDQQPVIHGKGVAEHTILIFIDDLLVLSTVVDANGEWSIETPILQDGQHTVTFIQQSPTGLQSEETSDFVFTVDTQVDSVESDLPATHQILEVEGSDFIVNNNEIADQILTVKGQITGLYPGDAIGQVVVEIQFESSNQVLSLTLQAQDIDANGVWTANFPLDGITLSSGNAVVNAYAQINDSVGNSADLVASEQPFLVDLVYAQADTAEVSFETIQADYTLDPVNSTQFLNILDVSDRLNTNLENGTVIEIGQSTSSSMLRSFSADNSAVFKTDVVGKVVVSYTDQSLLTVAKSYGVVLQKLDENGEWQYYMSAPLGKDGVVASLGTQYALGAIDNEGNRTVSFEGLGAGEYRVSSYVVPSELTQFLQNFELANIGSEGTLLGQQNQDFLIDALSRTLGADSPSTQQLITIVQGLLKAVNTVTLPVSYILDKLLGLPILSDVINALDGLVDSVVAPLVTNTLEVLRNLEVNVSYSESYDQSSPVQGNVLNNDFDQQAGLLTTYVAVSAEGQNEKIAIEANGFTEIVGQYGILKINAAGDYSYTAFASSQNVNAVDQFIYTVKNENLSQDVALDIKINGPKANELIAIDDENNIELVVDPSVTVQDLQSVTAGGLAYVGLGSVLDLNTIQISNVLKFDIANDTQRALTLKAESGGVQVLTDFDLYIYKWNAEFQQYELYKQEQNWFGVALLGGASDELSMTLDSGQYIALLEPTRGVNALYGYTLKTTQDLLLDYTQPISVAGQSIGNVIDDINQTLGSKDYSPNQDLLYITAVNGEAIREDQQYSGLTIQGQYGSLTIQANGDYVYTAYSEKTFNYGAQDSFSYTVYDPILKQSQTANLSITLDYIHHEHDMNTVNVDLLIDPSEVYYQDLSVQNTVTQGKKSTTGFGVANIGLGDALSADIISSKPGLKISVQQGELVSMQFSATGTSVVGLGNVSDLMIYKKNESTGSYELYYSSENFLIVPLAVLGIPLGGIYNTPESVMFSEGEYVAYLTTAGVSVVGGNTLTADHMTVYDYNETDSYSGDLDGQLVLTTEQSLLQVNDQKIVGDTVSIQGEYGTLVMSQSGTYHYEVDASVQPPQYGKIDTFSYVVMDALTGESHVAILNIKLSTIDAQADILDVNGQELYTIASMTNAFNTDAIIFESVSDLSKTNKVQATSLDKFTKKIQFDVSSGAESKGLKLSFEGLADISSAKVTLTYSLVLLKNSSGQTVNQVLATDTITNTTQASLDLELHDLQSGQYELVLNMPGKEGSIRYYGYDVQVFNQFADQWASNAEVAETDAVVKGNLLSNDTLNDALLAHTTLTINHKTLILDPAHADVDIVVTGQYGVLTVKADGSYSYVSNGSGGGKEIFVYELSSPTGDTDKSSLEINVGKNVQGSSHDDQIESGSANDIYTLSDGADTVIFSLLNDLDAVGGNGRDVWRDFSSQDKIDISALLIKDANTNITDYISVTLVNGDTVISIDRDGKHVDQNNIAVKDQFESTQLLTLQSTELTLTQLLQNQQIIY